MTIFAGDEVDDTACFTVCCLMQQLFVSFFGDVRFDAFVCVYLFTPCAIFSIARVRIINGADCATAAAADADADAAAAAAAAIFKIHIEFKKIKNHQDDYHLSHRVRRATAPHSHQLLVMIRRNIG